MSGCIIDFHYDVPFVQSAEGKVMCARDLCVHL